MYRNSNYAVVWSYKCIGVVIMLLCGGISVGVVIMLLCGGISV